MDDSQSPSSPLIKTRVTRERYPHSYKECFVPLSNQCGTYIPPPKGAQRPRWHTDPSSGSDTICNSPDLSLARYCPFCGLHAPRHGFAFVKSMGDSQSPPSPLVKTRLTKERNSCGEGARSPPNPTPPSTMLSSTTHLSWNFTFAGAKSRSNNLCSPSAFRYLGSCRRSAFRWEQQNLFFRKLQVGFFVFNFFDTLKNVREKEIKQQTLMELVELIQ
ncbi:hypothetical protein PIB30_058577 [Stylosanthes scabra]|uniref:Uncharacterized protein n=1 Tax=Stylosanthes scabra TaxID=79078 RepID=A0ABU6RKB7_9FABA|nr:hypothetical protein [Stylosanthes scabra]